MIWMDVDTALAEVPVNSVPLTDDTDFKTIETSVAYNAAGLTLYWHFVTTAGAETTTQVTPTTGGSYDWAHAGQGMYTIEIPSSGGASINNDTEGYGYFTGVATGVLPWRGPTIGFRAAGLNNLLIDSAHSTTRGLAGTALPDAAAEASGGLFTRGTGAGQINQDGNGRIDVNLKAILGTVLTETAGYIAAAFKKLFNVATPTAQADNLPTTTELNARTLASADYATAASLATVAGYLDTEIAAILEDTGTTIPAQIAALNNLSAAQVNAEVVDALNVDTYGESTGVPAATASIVAKIKFLTTLARNKQTRTATTATLMADDGSTAIATATLSDDGTTFTRTEWV